jgi:ADP-ribose pyrophosphatase
MNDTPQTIGEPRVAFAGNIHQIVWQKMQLGDKEKTFGIAERAPGTRLIIISNGEILLSKEWRREQDTWDYRLPGGKVFDTLEEFNTFKTTEKNILEKASEAAKKEAHEEVGIEVKELTLYTVRPCGATIGWDLYYFIVSKYSELENQVLEEGEHIQINWFSIKEVISMCLEGKIKEDRSVAVLLQYLHSLKEI